MKLFRRIRYWLRSRQNALDLAEEMEFHRAMLEGRALEMGNVTLALEDARAVWIWPWLEGVLQDTRHALRTLRMNKKVALVAIIALGAAIGMNTSLFSVFNAIALRPWPVRDAARVVTVQELPPASSAPSGFVYPEYIYFAQNVKSFAGITASYNRCSALLQVGKASCAWVSANFFSALGVDMLRGRGFLPEEDVVGSPQTVVVIANHFWRTRLGADPDLVGKTIRVESNLFKVVGITAESFTGITPNPVDFYIPMAAAPLLEPKMKWIKSFLREPEYCCAEIAGKLAEGVSREKALAELTLLSDRFSDMLHWRHSSIRITGTTFASIMSPSTGRMIGAMAVGLALVLLLACANVGNLLVARAWARRKEISIRMSVGASRTRVVRQLLTESLVLALAAGAVGVALAYWLPEHALRLAGAPETLYSLQPDATVLFFALGLSLLTCLLFGVAPALQGTKLRSSKHGLRSALLAVQVALSVVLLVSAGLLTHAVQSVSGRNPGFQIDGISVATFELPVDVLEAKFLEHLSTELLRVGVALTDQPPLTPGLSLPLAVDGQTPPAWRNVIGQSVSADFFDVLKIPLLKGRNFQPGDEKRRVMVLNQAMADQFFPGQNPVGRRIATIDREHPSYEVIGVVGNAAATSLGEVEPTEYGPWGESAWNPKAVYRTSPETTATVIATVKQIDPRAITKIAPLSGSRERWMQPLRAGATIAGVLAVFSLLLAMVGIFGVFSYIVEQRTKEIGIRMALGAEARQVITLIARSSSASVLSGLAIGVTVAAIGSGVLKSFLYGVSPLDPWTYAFAAVVLSGAGAMAIYIPSRRAVSIDPLIALRTD